MSTVNEDLTAIFEDMADLLEKKGDLIFKIRAYRRAAEIISEFPFSLDSPVRHGQDLQKIPGFGKAISSKIHEYVTTGQIGTYERLKAEFPDHEGIQSTCIVDCTNYFRGVGLIQDKGPSSDDPSPQEEGKSH